MRMAVDQFLAKAVAHVFDVERRFFFTDLGIEDNVQEQVAQFFFVAIFSCLVGEEGGVSNFIFLLPGDEFPGKRLNSLSF